MDKKEAIRIALWCDMKGVRDFETLKYSDEMYGRENQTDVVWEYVTEMREIGTIAFNEKYKDILS